MNKNNFNSNDFTNILSLTGQHGQIKQFKSLSGKTNTSSKAKFLRGKGCYYQAVLGERGEGISPPTKFFISCKESRIENTTCFYGCFYLGPFDESLSQTLANDLRRTLLSELTGFAITSVEIEGVLHKFSSLPGMKESVLDFICNLQTIVLKKNATIPSISRKLTEPFISSQEYEDWGNSISSLSQLSNVTKKTKKTYTGFLKVRGPRVIKAIDLKLPAGIQCVDPNQYIATLAEDGIINMKFTINEGKNYLFQKSENLDIKTLKKRNLLLYKTKKTTNSIKNFKNNQPGSTYSGKETSGRSIFSNEVAENSWLNQVNLAPKVNQNTISGTKVVREKLGKTETSFTNNNKKNQKQDFISEKITLDAVFMPVTKVNCIIEDNNLATDLEIFKTPKNNLNLSVFTKDKKEDYKDTELMKLNNRKSNISKTKSENNFKFDQFTHNSINLNSDYSSSNDSGLEINSTLPFEDRKYQTSLFFKNATILNQKNIQLNSLYFQINQQSKVKLIPWFNNKAISYFNIQEQQSTGFKDDLKLGVAGGDLPFASVKTKEKIQTLLNFSNLNKTKGLIPITLDNREPKTKAIPHVAKRLLFSNKYFVSTHQVLPWGILAKMHNFNSNFVLTSCKMEFDNAGKTGGNLSNLKNKLPNLVKINNLNYLDHLNLEYSNILKLKPILKKTHLILEIWTNGSVHPREALYKSLSFLANTFLKLQNIKMLGSMFKSELAYGNINKIYHTPTRISKTKTNISLLPPMVKEQAPPRESFKIKRNANGVQESTLGILQGNTSVINTALNSSGNLYIKRSVDSLNIPIGILPISLRSYTILRKAQIFTVAQLINLSKTDLLNFKNFGPKSLFEIEQCLINLGLALKN